MVIGRRDVRIVRNKVLQTSRIQSNGHIIKNIIKKLRRNHESC